MAEPVCRAAMDNLEAQVKMDRPDLLDLTANLGPRDQPVLAPHKSKERKEKRVKPDRKG